MPKVKLNLKELSTLEKVAKARQIVTSLTGNPSFTTPHPTLALLRKSSHGPGRVLLRDWALWALRASRGDGDGPCAEGRCASSRLPGAWVAALGPPHERRRGPAKRGALSPIT